MTPYQSNSGVNYQFKFTAPASNEWTNVKVPYDDMFMSIRGFRPPIYPKITGEKVHKIGLLIADKNFSDKFSLTVQSITGYQ